MTTAERIANANALLEGTSVAPITVPVMPVTDSKRHSMSLLKPSNGQMRRINAKHRAMGLREYGPRQFATVFPTMLDASDYYAEIKA